MYTGVLWYRESWILKNGDDIFFWKLFIFENRKVLYKFNTYTIEEKYTK